MLEFARTYRKYDALVKQEIVRTGNVYLFPDLGIPRTTAQYWVNKSLKGGIIPNADVDSVYRRKCEFLERELKKERTLRMLVERVRKIFPKSFESSYVKSKLTRRQIVAAVKECAVFHKIADCLSAIGLSKNSYQRWASEASFCARSKLPCQRRRPTQLTDFEILEMKKFVTSQKFAHISISSLHLLAQRTGALFCGIDTWYKYVRYYGWERPLKVFRKKIRKTGIRASAPNEIWHVDVTVVNVSPGRKLYIQAVIDNFSRYVLAWRVTDSIGAAGTVEVLKLAKRNAHGIGQSVTVLTDPGSENNNQVVTQFTLSSSYQKHRRLNTKSPFLFYSAQSSYSASHFERWYAL